MNVLLDTHSVTLPTCALEEYASVQACACAVPAAFSRLRTSRVYRYAQSSCRCSAGNRSPGDERLLEMIFRRCLECFAVCCVACFCAVAAAVVFACLQLCASIIPIPPRFIFEFRSGHLVKARAAFMLLRHILSSISLLTAFKYLQRLVASPKTRQRLIKKLLARLRGQYSHFTSTHRAKSKRTTTKSHPTTSFLSLPQPLQVEVLKVLSTQNRYCLKLLWPFASCKWLKILFRCTQCYLCRFYNVPRVCKELLATVKGSSPLWQEVSVSTHVFCEEQRHGHPLSVICTLCAACMSAYGGRDCCFVTGGCRCSNSIVLTVLQFTY